MHTQMPMESLPREPSTGGGRGELAFGRSFSRRRAWVLTTCIYHMHTGAETRASCPTSPARAPSLGRKTREKERREGHLDPVPFFFPFKTNFIEIELCTIKHTHFKNVVLSSDQRIQPYEQHHNQNIDHSHQPPEFPRPWATAGAFCHELVLPVP